MKRARLASLVLSLPSVAACTPEVPASPSFQQDIMPILAANCIRCHGDPPIGGAPREFRLDTFDDVAISDGEVRPDPVCGGDPADPTARVVICGAARYAAISAFRVRDERAPMPPRFPLDDYQIETLEQWARAPGRGAPRPTNAVPEVAIEGVVQAGAVVTVRARVDDADRDLVAGSLHARVGTTERLVGALRTGTVEIAWDTTGVAPGTYPLAASVDDGAQLHELGLGTITIGAP